MKFKMDIGKEQNMKVTQNVGDLKAGNKYGDYSRISAYRRSDIGVHTGSNSPTLGRNGKPFGK